MLSAQAAYDARASAIAAGFPETVPVQVINRCASPRAEVTKGPELMTTHPPLSFCSSGLMAVSNVANQIRNGEIEIGFAVGFESMSATCVAFVSAWSDLWLTIDCATVCTDLTMELEALPTRLPATPSRRTASRPWVRCDVLRLKGVR